MTATYTTRNRWTKQAIGSNTNTWGDVLNLVFDLMDASDDGVTTVSQTTPYTLTTANGATDEARRRVIRYTGATASTITIPAVEKVYLVDAVTADCTITNGSNSVTVPGGMSSLIYTNGTLMRTIQNRWFANQRITGVASPTVSTDAANKGYVDSQAFEAAAGNLPGQPGNAGKFLTTDGTNASWASTSFSFGSLTIASGGTYTAGQITDAIGITDDIRRVGDIVYSAGSLGSAYLLCDGSNYLRTAYASLSALMPDGRNALTTVTPRTYPGTADFRDIAYGLGVFVVIGAGGNGFISSADGENYTQRTSPNTSAEWQSVAFGGGLFVAVASGSNVAASTASGTSWTARTLPASKSWSHIAFGNGAFLALSTNSGASNAATTADAVSWVSRTAPGSEYTDLLFANGQFIALRAGAIDITTNGETWTTIIRLNSSGWQFTRLTFGNGVYVGYGDGSRVFISTDLRNWSRFDAPVGNISSIGIGNGLFLAVSGQSGNAATSVDGRSWALVVASGIFPASADDTAVAYGAGVFAGVGNFSTDAQNGFSTNNILDTTRFRVPDLRGANGNELPYIKAVA